MSTQKNNKHSSRFNFTTFQMPESIEEPIIQANTQSRRRPKQFSFRDPEENIQSDHRYTPIEIINQESSQLQRQRPSEQQIIIIPAPSLVEEDKLEANLDVQTSDQQQREKISQSISPLHQTALSQLALFAQKHSTQKRINLFFEFYYNIIGWLAASENCVSDNKRTSLGKEELRRWIQRAIKLAKEQNSRITFKSNSQMLDDVLSGNEQQLIDKLTSQGKYQQSLIVSNRFDAVSRGSLSRGILAFKKEFNLIKSQSLGILTKTCWLFEFIYASEYFTESSLVEFGSQIFNRYVNHSDSVFQPELVFLGLLCQKDSQSKILQEDLLKALRAQHQEFSENILLLFLLSDYKAQYPKAYYEITQAILKMISNPRQLIAIFSYTSLGFDQAKSLLQVYLKQNPTFLSTGRQYAELMGLIKEQKELASQHEYYSVLAQWSTYEEVKQLYDQGNDMAFIEAIVREYQVLKRSSGDNLMILMEQLKEAIASFKLSCNYKKQKRKDYYHLLHRLDNSITASSIVLNQQLSQNEKAVIDLVRGIQSFLELTLGIFNLSDPRKLQEISGLHCYLSQRLAPPAQGQDHKDLQRFKRYLEEAVQQALYSREGKIYITKLLSQQQEQSQKVQVGSIKVSQPATSNADKVDSQPKREQEVKKAGKNKATIQRIVKIVGKRGLLPQNKKLTAAAQL